MAKYVNGEQVVEEDQHPDAVESRRWMAADANQKCPSCGYCPTCKRKYGTNLPGYPWYPYIWWQYPVTATSGTVRYPANQLVASA